MPAAVLGALYLIIAEASFAALGALVKHLGETLDHSQMVFFRNFFALVTLAPWFFRNGREGLKTDKLGLHLFRATLGLTAMYCFFYVLTKIPLAEAMMVILMSPFFIPIIARVWLGEKITLKTLLALFIAFAGAGLAVNPEGKAINLYLLLALVGAVLVAFTKVAIRKLTNTETTGRIVFIFALFGTLVSAIPWAIHYQPVDLITLLKLMTIGVLAAIGQLLMTKSFQLASPARIGLLTYLSVVFAALLGYWFWGEPITAGLVIGAVLILWAANLTTRQRWLL